MYYISRPPSRFDPALLLPGEGSPGRRFETLDDAREAWGRIKKSIRGVSDPVVSDAVVEVDNCTSDHRCGRSLCRRCGRLYRRWKAGSALSLVARAKQSYHVTIYGECFGPGALGDANVRRFHDRLRQRIRRAGLATTVIIGGTEVAWSAQKGQWLLHVHLLVLDPPAGALARLAKRCRIDNDHGAPAMKSRLVKDPATVATYLQKFQFYHHPGKRTGSSRPRAVPLPEDRAVEYAQFLIRHGFQDFLFLSGCRRRGHRIVPLAPKKAVTT